MTCPLCRLDLSRPASSVGGPLDGAVDEATPEAAAPGASACMCEANQDADWLLTLAVHDLRNALSALQLGVELLSRRESTAHPPSAAVLAHMDSAAQRAQACTVEVEDIHRLATGRRVAVTSAHFSLHAVVRDALDACRRIVPGVVVEHDRLGDGDCVGDAGRMAQFLALALEDLCVEAPPARVIVISEVAGDRFRIALHVGSTPDVAWPTQAPTQRAARAHARRCVLLRAIAQAHGGDVRLHSPLAHGRSIDASFSSLAAPR